MVIILKYYSQFMKNSGRIIIISLFLLLLIPSFSLAQRIGFGLSFGEGVRLTNLGSDTRADGVLDFNSVLSPPVLLARDPKVTISPQQNESGVVIFEIEAPADADITVTITAPPGNQLIIDDPSNSEALEALPFQIGWAYWNLGTLDTGTIQIADFSNAREMVSTLGSEVTFSSATFPLKRNLRVSAGPPPPPPMPNFRDRDTIEAPVVLGRAFLLVYGSVGPIPENPQVGTYTGTIDIHIELSRYNIVENP